ncbi:UDP-glucuronate 4-epimerase [Ruminiclostridium sufflavum DSM 19573]|uniref:UDP-glucuronate 4-epimerase n=1 Tax=Ruminiclostridium sufflavum DSM 19573 TaxID=1121337 RepID=A0A318XNB5_9FIRM|nr:NAD-dependent epimerase [Ruminiclostridium sufflavum]PYG89492.1 UDP-glucuronate 4-epimerase [Ruminiclostridium sufflavum DSM 19573]
MKKILVTGNAGFIGMHLSKKLLTEGYHVLGIDNLNDYYSVDLKKQRISLLKPYKNFSQIVCSLEDCNSINSVFKDNELDCVINLAAQAGVRYSIKNPRAYIDSNITGFLNILEGCRHHKIPHLIYASSSSVYGANEKVPFSIHDNADHPMSLYAATKKSNELMAHAYSSLYGLPVTGLRFFTVYGPFGRPDMAYFLFADAIKSGKPIKIFNFGKMQRDFTYIDDIVEGIVRLIRKGAPKPNEGWNRHDADPAASYAPYRLFNIGNNRPVELEYMILLLEKYMDRKAEREYLPMQQGDVPVTYAELDDLTGYIGFKPRISIEEGLLSFAEWFREYGRL